MQVAKYFNKICITGGRVNENCKNFYDEIKIAEEL